MKQLTKQIKIGEYGIEPNHVFIKNSVLDGEMRVCITKDPAITETDEATYARIVGSCFQDGTIEVKVRSRLLPDAPDYARGFIGVAFRIDETNTKFEAIYIRPTNGRCEEQVRRNRTMQYFAYPDFKYERMREEFPGKYETYADIGIDEWICLKIIVDGECAYLYLNDAKHTALIVTDLKHGKSNKGAIGLWVDIGTEGFFRDLKITAR